MKPREIMLETIRHRQAPVVPYTLYFEGGTDLELDAHLGSTHWRERLIPYIVTVTPVHTDIRIPLDEGRELDGYGGIWRVDRLPWHLEKPPLERPSLEGYAFPAVDTFYRPEWKAEAERTIEQNPDSYIMGGLGWGLFERSWNLRGFENLLLDSITEPDFFEEVLDRLTALYLELVDRTVELPVDGILFGDDWGHQQGIILGANRWRRFLKPRWAKIYARVHEHGRTVFHHSCGSVAEIMPDLVEIGMDFLESVQPEAAGMDPYELKKRWGDKIGFWGGLGSQSVVPFGTPEDIRREVRKLRRVMGQDGGYILAPAKPVQPGTPVENAAALLEVMTEA